jgi:hypothetical protein
LEFKNGSFWYGVDACETDKCSLLFPLLYGSWFWPLQVEECVSVFRLGCDVTHSLGHITTAQPSSKIEKHPSHGTTKIRTHINEEITNWIRLHPHHQHHFKNYYYFK